WRIGALAAREDTLAGRGVPELGGARVHARRPLEPVGSAPMTDVLARAGPDAWLVRHGRMVVLGSRLVPEEVDLPVSGAFVPFVGALVGRIARGESGVLEVAPGEPVPLPAGV